jgi:glycosyltransferase involved in cell wall biosynthesis
MEALALGRPAIATDVGAVSELVEPEETGWLVPASAVEPLVDAIRAAATAPVAELERMGAAGATRVRDRHDASREAARLEALFRASVG